MDRKEKVTQMCFILFLVMGSDLIYIFLLSVETDVREADDLKVLPNFELPNLSVRPDCFAS